MLLLVKPSNSYLTDLLFFLVYGFLRGTAFGIFYFYKLSIIENNYQFFNLIGKDCRKFKVHMCIQLTD